MHTSVLYSAWFHCLHGKSTTQYNTCIIMLHYSTSQLTLVPGLPSPDERVRVGRWGRHLGVVQVLLRVPVGVEARRDHGIRVFLQQLTDHFAPGMGWKVGFFTVHVVSVPWWVRWHWFYQQHTHTYLYVRTWENTHGLVLMWNMFMTFSLSRLNK